MLLKNGKSGSAGPLLPLPKKLPKILVAGSHADNLGYQCGGWTIEWQGLGGNDLTAGTIFPISIHLNSLFNDLFSLIFSPGCLQTTLII